MLHQAVSISRAKLSDAHKIRRLETSVWKSEVTNKYDMPMFVRFGYVYAAKEGKRLVGGLVAHSTKDGEIYVCDWVVDKKYRGNGVGWRLYQRLLQDTRKKTLVTFVAVKNKVSLAGHKKLGFKIVKRVKDPYLLNQGDRFFLRRIS